jgi:hypothetical protein
MYAQWHTGWIEKNKVIAERMRDFEYGYREKKCSSCPMREQARCSEINGQLFCKKMLDARNRKFKFEITGQVFLATKINELGDDSQANLEALESSPPLFQEIRAVRRIR